MKKTCLIIIFLIVSLGFVFEPPLCISAEKKEKKKKTRQATPPITTPRIDTSARLALVIGNSAYEFFSLKNPVNDASDMAAVLKELGFDVIIRKNADLQKMVEALEEFGARLKKGGVGLFFYAGHGIQVKNINYLIPIGAQIKTESDVEFKALHAGRVLGKMDDAENGLNIVILDACRDNPFARQFRSASRGLANISGPPGTYIAYSTALGETADDGQGRNSPFTAALLETIKNPNLSIDDVFISVRQKLGKKQVPWTHSSINEKFYFKPSLAALSVEKDQDEAGRRKQAEEEKRLEAERLKEEKDRKKIEARKKQQEDQQRLKEEKKQKEEEKADRAVWNTKLKNMKTAFEKTEQFEKKKVAPDDKIVAWQRFLDTYQEKNPYSDEDTRLREKAGERIKHWGNEKNAIAEKKGKLEAQKKEEEEKRKQAEEQKSQVAERLKVEKEQKQIEAQKKREEERQRLDAEKKRIEEEKQTLAEQKKKKTEETEPSSPSTYTDPVTGIEMVPIKGGCYQMGDTFGDGAGDEKPVHEVCVEDFYLGKYEVTQGQWKAIMGNNPSHFKNGDNYPVETISWYDAQEFIRKLNQRTGKKYRLPTEAEWEYAARSGGKKEKWAGTSNESSELGAYDSYKAGTSNESELRAYAWYNGNSGGRTHPVGENRSNGLGLYDMSGNVWEWVEDTYDSNAYQQHSRNNPIYTGSSASRVVRGGAWINGQRYVRAADRAGDTPGDRSNNLGFRLAGPK